MRHNRNPIVRDVAVVAMFWWSVFSLVHAYQVFDSSYSLRENWDYFVNLYAHMPRHLRWCAGGAFIGAFLSLWTIFFKRDLARGRVAPTEHLGVHCTMGKVPFLAKEAPRAKKKATLPITSKVIKGWLDANKERHPEHVALFNAVWETLSAHKSHPASPYRAGHGGKLLWEHSQNVAEQALLRAKDWKYDGIFFDDGRRKRTLVIPKLNPNYAFDPDDPLIPLVAIAHDLGKIETYILQPDGSVKSLESRNGIRHDGKSAQMLARMAEFHNLPGNDSWILVDVVGQYHNKLHMRVDKSGACYDDRVGSLIQFLNDVDRATGILECGGAEGAEATLSEEDSQNIYKAFVDIVTEHGRINGTGDHAVDKRFKIGQKHEGLIYIREQFVRQLILKKVQISQEQGTARYRSTLALLRMLEDKGLLSCTVNGYDFSEYLPLQTVTFHDAAGKYITTWDKVIVIRLNPAASELMSLARLQNFTPKARVKGHFYGHQPALKGDTKLAEMLQLAFGKDAVASTHDDKASGNDEQPVDDGYFEDSPPALASSTEANPIALPSSTPAVPKEALAAEDETPEVILDSAVTMSNSTPGAMAHSTAMSLDDVLGDLQPVSQDIDIFTGRAIAQPKKATVLDSAANLQRAVPDEVATMPSAPARSQVDPSLPPTKPLVTKGPSMEEAKARFEESRKGWIGRREIHFQKVSEGSANATKPSADSLAQIQDAVANNRLFTLHKHDGIHYVEKVKVEALFPDLDLDSLIESKRITRMELANIVAVGIPEKR
ncbi:hypothetical protein RY831_15280 [Noviherbaspirillum sp. CPCC 100848]|uniref:Uncharacterized protein n=1 Tax=Noviherbaspirillum album TaxID=3080276 RepID=A0ABU6JBK2_9BURK|nr:hypothetical protein [Noviherbaspirillum sp. CPCC 100848]MEC4720524.1 hypothetical protein [Noviherbaspirillum sp. CPCC 100848]